MHIVIDLQGAQSDSRYRGIGRYSLSLAKAIAANKENHSVTVALSSLFPQTIAPIRASFKGLLPNENIRIWSSLAPVYEYDKDNTWRRKASELIREAFYVGLKADIVFVSSFMEGFAQNVVTSVGSFTTDITNVITLYDLIPLINHTEYLDVNLSFKNHYMRKIEQLKSADGILAISEYSAKEGIEHLNISKEKICNVSSGCDSIFKPRHDDVGGCSIDQPYILYTGGADSRKNLPKLICAYSMLPQQLQDKYSLVIVGKIKRTQKYELLLTAMAKGIDEERIVFTGYVSDEALVSLYNNCALFVFPSWHEGFGLPALEAIKCGAPVIGSATSSLPEVIGTKEALFDPYCIEDISRKIERVLLDVEFRKKLVTLQSEHAERFSWDTSAKRAIKFFEKIKKKPTPEWNRKEIISKLIDKISDIQEGLPSKNDLLGAAMAIAANHNSGDYDE